MPERSAMSGDVIREVENDPKEGVVVTLEEGAASIDVPPPCAGCLGEATRRLPSIGVSWPEFPYCDACVPPRADEAERRETVRDLPLLRFLFFGFIGILSWMFVKDVAGPRGNAVKLMHSDGGTLRLAFKNDEYARLFVEANGAEMPQD